MLGGRCCLMICLRERKRINISNGTRKREKNRRGMRFVPHDEQRTTPSFSLFLYIYIICRSFVDRVLHRIIASTHTHTNMHGANLGECKKMRGTDIREEKSLSFMHKQHTVVDTLFFPHHLLLFLLLRLFLLPSRFVLLLHICLSGKKTGNNLSSSFSSYTHHIICYSLRYTCD